MFLEIWEHPIEDQAINFKSADLINIYCLLGIICNWERRVYYELESFDGNTRNSIGYCINHLVGSKNTVA